MLELDAVEEQLNGETGWKIFFPSDRSCFLLKVNNHWKLIGDGKLSPEMIEHIGRSLHPLAISNLLNQRNLVFKNQC